MTDFLCEKKIKEKICKKEKKKIDFKSLEKKEILIQYYLCFLFFFSFKLFYSFKTQ